MQRPGLGRARQPRDQVRAARRVLMALDVQPCCLEPSRDHVRRCGFGAGCVEANQGQCQLGSGARHGGLQWDAPGHGAIAYDDSSGLTRR